MCCITETKANKMAKKRRSSPVTGKIAGKLVRSIGKSKIFKALSGEGTKEVRQAITAVGRKAVIIKAGLKKSRRKKA